MTEQSSESPAQTLARIALLESLVQPMLDADLLWLCSLARRAVELRSAEEEREQEEFNAKIEHRMREE